MGSRNKSNNYHRLQSLRKWGGMAEYHISGGEHQTKAIQFFKMGEGSRM